MGGSNPRPPQCHCGALPTELTAQELIFNCQFLWLLWVSRLCFALIGSTASIILRRYSTVFVLCAKLLACHRRTSPTFALKAFARLSSAPCLSGLLTAHNKYSIVNQLLKIIISKIIQQSNKLILILPIPLICFCLYQNLSYHL